MVSSESMVGTEMAAFIVLLRWKLSSRHCWESVPLSARHPTVHIALNKMLLLDRTLSMES
jgi:hypothetical protein